MSGSGVILCCWLDFYFWRQKSLGQLTTDSRVVMLSTVASVTPHFCGRNTPQVQITISLLTASMSV